MKLGVSQSPVQILRRTFDLCKRCPTSRLPRHEDCLLAGHGGRGGGGWPERECRVRELRPEAAELPPSRSKQGLAVVGSHVVAAAGEARGTWRRGVPWKSSWFPPRTRPCSVLWSKSSTTWWAWARFNSFTWRRTSKRPALVLTTVWRGSVGAVLRRDNVARTLRWKSWTFFLRASLLEDTCPRASDSPRWLLEEFLAVVFVKVFSNPAVDSLFALEIWISSSPLYLTVTAPDASVGGFCANFTHFTVKNRLRALDSQQLWAIEGSSVLCIINLSDLWTYTSRLFSARV